MAKIKINSRATAPENTYVCLVPTNKSTACGGCPTFADKGRAYYFIDQSLSPDAVDLVTFRCVNLAELISQPGMDEQMQDASYGKLIRFEDAEGNRYHIQTLSIFFVTMEEFLANLVCQTKDMVSVDEIFEEGIESRYLKLLDPDYKEADEREWGDTEDESFGILADFCLEAFANIRQEFRFWCEAIADWADRAVERFERAKREVDTVVTLPEDERTVKLKAETTQYFLDYSSGEYEYDLESDEFARALEKTILVRRKVAVLNEAARDVYQDLKETLQNADL